MQPDTMNIPLGDLRDEFEAIHSAIESLPDSELDHIASGELRTSLGHVDLSPHEVVSLHLQRAILGLESYVKGMVALTADSLGCRDPELRKAVENPFSQPGRGAVKKLYCALPARLSPSYALDTSNPTLYEALKKFYSSTRNPIFHGRLVEADTLAHLREPFALIAATYAWVDTWRRIPERFRALF